MAMPTRGRHDLSQSGRARLELINLTANSTLMTSHASPPLEPVEVAFVNNMPDAAFLETEAQFSRMLAAAVAVAPILLTRYWLAGVPRGREIASAIATRYQRAEGLLGRTTDAVIITGTDPIRPELRAESFWPVLSDLIVWAQRSTTSSLLSCLAAHAAICCLEDLDRSPLPAKYSGLMAHRVNTAHPLAADLDREIAMPHSRRNGVSLAQLESRGYQRLLSSDDDWTILTKPTGQSQFILLQGHPEYDRDTLLKEYRRDLRRFIAGERASCPGLPTGYLTPRGQSLLADATNRAVASTTEGSPPPPFPIADLALEVTSDWSHSSARLYRNWIQSVTDHRRASASAPSPLRVAVG